MRIKQASHHKPPSLNLKKHANPASAARPAQGLDPAVVPFLDALAEIGARAVVRDLDDQRRKYVVRIKPKPKPVLRIVPRDKPKFVLAGRT